MNVTGAKWKRLLLVIALVGAVATTASRSEAAVSHARSHASTTISFLTPPWGIPPDNAALKAFQQQSGITVQVRSMPMAQLYSKVQIASATHQVPADVIFLSEEAPSNVVTPGDLIPLTSRISSTPSLNTSDIQQLQFWKYNGAQYGITSYVQLVMMDYDAARLRKAGFTAPPKTWAGVNSEALAIKRKGIDSYPLSLAGIDWSWYIIANSMGEKFFDKSLRPTFTAKNSAGRQAMRLLDQFYREKLISPTLLTQVFPHSEFESGVGTFHQGWEGSLAVMNNPKLSKHAPHVQYMLLPNKHSTWSFPAGLGISKYSSNQDAAWKFIEWYLQPAQQKAIYNAYGLVPSRTSVQHAIRGKIQGYGVISRQARYRHELPRYVKWWGPFTTYVTSEVRRVLAGQESPDGAINSIGRKWASLRSQYGG